MNRLFKKCIPASIIFVLLFTPFFAIAQTTPPPAPQPVPPPASAFDEEDSENLQEIRDALNSTDTSESDKRNAEAEAKYEALRDQHALEGDAALAEFDAETADIRRLIEENRASGGSATINESALASENFRIDAGCSFSLTSWFSGGVLAGCIVYGIHFIIDVLLRIGGSVLNMVSTLFSTVVAIQNVSFYDQIVVNTGWTIVRDITNVFFIFFILFIAIGIILGIQTFGGKQALFRLIIAALLVNFSFTIGGIIVDAGNVVGNTFYLGMGQLEDGRVDIGGVFTGAFNPTTLYTPPNETGVVNAFEGTDVSTRFIRIIIAQLSGLILIGIAIFTMFTASMFLIIRIIAIWFLLILSPIAFAFWVLPSTQGTSRRWFTELFSQAIFYPLLMFFLYLTIKIIQADVVSGLINQTGGQFNQTLQGSGESLLVTDVGIILNLILLGALMIASITVAKSVGGTATSLVVSQGEKWRGKIVGYGKTYGGRAVNRAAAPLSQKVLEGRVAQQVARIPVLKNALKVPVASLKKAETDLKRQTELIKSLSPEAAGSYIKGLSGPRAKQVAYEQLNDKQKTDMLKKMDRVDQVRLAHDLNRVTNDVGKRRSQSIYDPDSGEAPKMDTKYSKDIAKRTGDIESALRVLHQNNVAAAGTREREQQVGEYLSSLKEKELSNLTADSIRSSDMRQHILNMSAHDIRRMADSKDQAEAIQEVFRDIISDRGIAGADTTEQLQNLGREVSNTNQNLGRFLQNSPAAQIIILEGRQAGQRDVPTGHDPSSGPPPSGSATPGGTTP